MNLSKNRSFIIYFFCTAMLFFYACQQTNTENKEKNKDKDQQADADTAKAVIKDTEPFDRQFNDLARLLAGMPAEEGSSFAELHKNQNWINYAKKIDSTFWKPMQDKRPVMSKWREDELKVTNEAKGTLFYPFSGADFLYANTFFPTVDTIVMFGLEPIGSMPDVKKIADKNFLAYLNGLEKTLATILQKSYFITLEMNTDFRGGTVQDLDGTLPAFLIFMARTGQKILYYEKVAIGEDGKLIKADAAKNPKAYYGTKIEFRDMNDNKRKVLYYFGVNLCNDAFMTMDGLAQRNDLQEFIKKLNITSTYIKSASYLMHGNNFSIIRNLVLDNTKNYLQDDSGMALGNFKDDKWDLTFFGAYAGTIDIFRGYYQNDMKKVYEDKKYPIRPLPFGIGYMYKQGESNLMLAKRK